MRDCAAYGNVGDAVLRGAWVFSAAVLGCAVGSGLSAGGPERGMTRMRCFRVGERVWWRNAAGSLVSGIFSGLDADAQCWVIPEFGRSHAAIAMPPDRVFTLPHVTTKWEKDL